MQRLLFRIASGVALVVGLGAGVLTAAAHPQPVAPTLDVANPSDGDMLTPGRMVIQGIAYDDTAETGTGIDRVLVFLGNRDEENGAQFLGAATLGLHSPQAVEKGDAQFALAGWKVLTPVLKATGQHRSLYVYARSSVTGVEAIEIIRIVMGSADSGGDTGGGGGGGD